MGCWFPENSRYSPDIQSAPQSAPKSLIFSRHNFICLRLSTDIFDGRSSSVLFLMAGGCNAWWLMTVYKLSDVLFLHTEHTTKFTQRSSRNAVSMTTTRVTVGNISGKSVNNEVHASFLKSVF